MTLRSSSSPRISGWGATTADVDARCVAGARRNRGAHAVVVLLLVLVGLVAGAGAAFAHATLVTSSPGNGDVLPEAPSTVSVELSEPVTLGAGYLRVLDADGERVDTGNPTVKGSTVSVALPAGLPDGGYVATFRVISADSHPVSGAISFAVGDASPPQIDSRGTQIGGASDDPAVAVLYPVVRWAGYLGVALVAAGVLLALLDPAMWRLRAVRRWSWAGFDAALASTVLGALLQGPYAAGRGIGSLVDPALLSATLETEAGRMAAVRLIALGVLGVLLWEWFAAPRERRALTCSAGACVALCALTLAASGHAVAEPASWLTIPLQTVHLAAGVSWVGGLALLIAAVLRQPGSGEADDVSAAERGAVVRRFSTVAAWLVAAIVVTGVVAAFVRVGSWGALTGTSYGRLLMGKSALLAVGLVAAMFSRRLLRDPEEPTLRALRRPVVVEAIAGAGAIALAAVLVATPPARDSYRVARDAQVSFDNGYRAQISLDPARQGSNAMHVYLFDRSGQLAQIEEATVTVRDDAAQIGPLEVDARNVGQGHFIASGVELPASGRWTVSVTFTEPGFGAVTAEGSIDVA